jgi:acetyl-CoA carboxylase biotin carboxyl carrier protein
MIFGKKTVLALIELMDKHQLNELSIRNWFTSVEIKRGHAQARPSSISVDSEKADAWTGPLPAAEPPPPPPSAEAESPMESTSEKYFQVQAPLVGTFYRAPAPDAEAFVEIGDAVKSGETLCIIEAMKNMNEIQSDIDGVIREICVQNSSLVEFGQTLFRIEEIAGDS